jgi:hypothetical protein
LGIFRIILLFARHYTGTKSEADPKIRLGVPPPGEDWQHRSKHLALDVLFFLSNIRRRKTRICFITHQTFF